MQRLRRKLDRDRGSVAVEFALIVPVFLLLVYGGLSFGLAMSAKSVITEAAADGARSAIGASTATITSTAISEAKGVLNNEGSAYKNYASVTATLSYYPACSSSPSSVCVNVNVSYPYSSHPAIPNAPGLGLILPSSLSASYTVEVSQ